MRIFQSGPRAGFTLLELLVVVLILGILVAIAVPNYRRSLERTRVAESRTLLRAIYDSRERSAMERNYDSYSAIPVASRFGFNKLDITVKGTFSGTNNTQLTTANFRYDMSSTPLTATAIRGDYTGARVSYNGQQFTCTNGTSGEARKACTVWGASKWNER